MIGRDDSLLASYERGALSRRQLLGGRNLHHVNVQVSSFDWTA